MNDVCTWTWEYDGGWQTSCGHAFEFTVGRPTEDGFVFCPYCGLRLEAVEPLDDNEWLVTETTADVHGER